MEWAFNPVGGLWFASIIAVLLLLVPWVFPPRAIGLSRSRRRAMQVLRTLSILVLLTAWLRPTLIWVKSELLRPSLVMLFDASRSMTVEDTLDGKSRWAATRQLVDGASGAMGRLAAKQDIKAFTFDRELKPLSLESGRFTWPVEPTGEETAIGSALAEALDASRDEAGGEGTARVIVVSDGAQRAKPPRDTAPLSLISRLAAEGMAFFAVPVGQRTTGDRADVAIDDLVVSDTAFAGAPLDVGATLRVGGFPNRSVRVQLRWETVSAEGEASMEPVDAAQVIVRPGVEAYPITLRHAPTTPGEWKLSVVADPLEGETLADNNTASTFVTVREGGVRVLYLAGATRPGGAPGLEQRFVRSSLAASPDVVVERVALNYQPTRRDLTGRLANGAVDVVIVDNVDAEGLSRASWRALAELVESGAGMAMIGGRQSFGPGGHRDTFGDVLPITPGRAERQMLAAPMRQDVHLQGPLPMVPTTGPAGRHPIVNLVSEDGDDLWEQLPPLDGANRLGDALKPNAQVIATTAGRRPEPLLVIGQPGLGRVVAFAGDSTWRWVLAGQREAHQRFWRQAVLWLAKKTDDSASSVYLDLATRRVPAGSRLDLVAGVRLGGEEAAADPIRYQAIVRRPDGTTIELPLPAGGVRASGVYVETSAAGDYRVRVVAFRGDESLGTAESRFLVPKRDLELERPGAERDTLVRLAQATAGDGGRVVELEELPTLLSELAANPPTARRQVVARTTLYDKWPVLLLFAGLMTAEWLVRRGAGMP